MRWGAAAALGCALAVPRAAAAGVTLEVRPLFGDGCLPREGTGELRVRVENTGTRPLRGMLLVDAAGPRADRPRTRHAWAVGVGARAEVTLAVDTTRPVAGGAMTVRLVDDGGRTLASTAVALPGGEASLLLDATPGHRFANAQRSGVGGGLVGPEAPADPIGIFRALGAAADGAAGFGGVTCPVERPGGADAPRLPRLLAGYRGVALVLIDSEALDGLAPAERLSLAGYVAGGGSLAVIVRSPNDLRHPTLRALAGDDVATAPLPAAPDAFGPGFRPQPATLVGARSWGGGHLDPAWLHAVDRALPAGTLGATARYGDGLVHLLSWDPARPSSLEDPWSARTVLLLAARAERDRPAAVFPTVPETTPVPEAVRRYLTPSVRSGVGLLRALAVIAGYAAAALIAARLLRRRRGWSPAVHGALALAAWAALAREAAAHRVGAAQVRSLAVLDAPWGFSVASGRRFHAIVADRRQGAWLRLGGPERIVAVDPTAGRGPVTRVVDGSGAHLVGVGVRAWTPVVVREDGPEDLRGAVTLLRDADGALSVRNGLPWALREVAVFERASSSGWSLPAIAPGQTRALRGARSLPPEVVARFLPSGLATLPRWGSPEARALALHPPGPDPSIADVAGRLGRWFGHRTIDNPWEAVLASPVVPGRPDPWIFRDGVGLVARVDRPSAPTRAGLPLTGSTWLRVHADGAGP